MSIDPSSSKKINFPFALFLPLSLFPRNLIIIHSIDWLTYEPLHPFFRRQVHTYTYAKSCVCVCLTFIQMKWTNFACSMQSAVWRDFYFILFWIFDLRAQPTPKQNARTHLNPNSWKRTVWFEPHFTQIIQINSNQSSFHALIGIGWVGFIFLGKLNEWIASAA